MFKHTGLRPHMCEVCDQKFSRPRDLNRHMTIHTGEKKFKCEHCGHSANHPSNMKKHKRIHQRQKPNRQCTFCMKRITSKRDLETHELKHTGETPFKCTECYYSTNVKANLKRHTKDVHTEEDDEIIMSSDSEDDDEVEGEGEVVEKEVNVDNNPLKRSPEWKRKQTKLLLSGEEMFKSADIPFFSKIGGTMKVESGEQIVMCLINKSKLPTNAQTRNTKLAKFIRNKYSMKLHPDKFEVHLSQRFRKQERNFAKHRINEIYKSVIAYRNKLLQ